jgi:phosphatidylglycerophosphate synthase
VCRVDTGPLIAAGAATALLAALAVAVGLGTLGWVAGLAVTAGGAVALRQAMGVHGRIGLGPADRVTVTRAVLVVGVAALAVDALGRPAPAALVVLASVALALDAVDGLVARRADAGSAFGASLDMEVDAFLVLVLSLYVASTTGWWVLAIGAARYLLAGAALAWPWLRGSTPPRYWAKVVAAVQGVVLTTVAADVAPAWLEKTALGVALALLAESFGRQVRDLWGAAHPARRTRRRWTSSLVTAGSFALLWLALVLPADTRDLGLGMFLLVPLEGLLYLAVVIVLPREPWRGVVAGVGLLLGLVVVVELVDLAFDVIFDRPADPANDWVYLAPGLEVLATSVGWPSAIVVAAALALLAVGVLVVVAGLLLRVTRAARRHRRATTAALAGLAVVWVAGAVLGWQTSPRTAVAAWNVADRVSGKVAQTRAALADRPVFQRQIATDPLRGVPAGQLLDALRGKDVVLVFIESYGRAAVEDPELSPGIDAVLDGGTLRLEEAGFASRSAFLTSPTYGAASWLAHASLQSGLWVDSQHRYNQLLTAGRLTLTSVFGRAGWRTVLVAPATTHAWPEGERFYGFDEMYDAHDLGYAGPPFAFDSMPDQYTLAAFHRLELADADRRPVMAEVNLISSHHPWTPVPPVVRWRDVGDGSVFDRLPAGGPSQEVLFHSAEAVRAAYARSVEYTLRTAISFVETYAERDLVLVVVGDHQPHSYVSGAGAGHDVPVALVAQDPRVLRQVAAWGWQPGLNPGPDAPVTRMDTFRDRFVTAFGSTPPGGS